MQHAGATGDETLMVGDSWVDIETARRAGTRACFAAYGFGLPPADGLRDDEPRLEHLDALLSAVHAGRADAGARAVGASTDGISLSQRRLHQQLGGGARAQRDVGIVRACGR